MRRLLRAEVGRVRSRRMTWLVALAAVAIMAIWGYATWETSRPLSLAEQTQATQAYGQAMREWRETGAQGAEQCRADQARERLANPSADFSCEDLTPKPEQFGKPRPELATLLPQAATASGLVSAMLAFLLGTSLVAAEFSTGMMGVWLTFEPRRTRVWAAKVLTPTALAALASAGVVLALYGASWLITASAEGQLAMTAAQSGDSLLGAARVVAVGVLASLGGALSAFLIRSTAAVIGLVFAYLIVVESVFRGLFNEHQTWLLSLNLSAFLDNGTTFMVDDCRQNASATYGCSPVEHTLTVGQGATFLTVLVGLTAALSWLSFRRRDIG